jgi:hypothetical protein
VAAELGLEITVVPVKKHAAGTGGSRSSDRSRVSSEVLSTELQDSGIVGL